MERDRNLKVDVDSLDDDTRCAYCIYSFDCEKDVKVYDGIMICPYCADNDPEYWFDEEEYLKNLEESEENGWRD